MEEGERVIFGEVNNQELTDGEAEELWENN